MKEDYGMKRSRISKFVIEPINDKFSEKGGEISPGPLSGLLLRNKYEGIKIKIHVIADSVMYIQASVQNTTHFNCKYYRLYNSKPPVVEAIPSL